MGSQAAILTAAGILAALWFRRPAGIAALRFATLNPIVFLPPLAVLAAMIGLTEADLGDLDRPFWNIKFSAIHLKISVTLLLQFAAHAAGSTWLLWLLSCRIPGLPPLHFGRALLSITLVLFLAWTAMFALIALAVEMGVRGYPDVIFLVVLPMAVAFFLLNLAVAPLASTLALARGRLLPALSPAFARLRSGGWRRYAAPVFLRLLLTGAVVIVWLDGYVVRHTPTQKTLNAFALNVKASCLLNLSVDNEWYDDLVEATESKYDRPTHYALGGLTACLSALFLCAFALLEGGYLTHGNVTVAPPR